MSVCWADTKLMKAPLVDEYETEGDSLSDEDRAALDRSLRRGIEQADGGQLVDAEEVLAEFGLGAGD